MKPKTSLFVAAMLAGGLLLAGGAVYGAEKPPVGETPPQGGPGGSYGRAGVAPIFIRTPHGGERWVVNSPQTLEWTYNGSKALNVVLEQNGTRIGVIFSFGEARRPTFGRAFQPSWNVGEYFANGTTGPRVVAPTGDGYVIKVRERGTGGFVAKSNPFSIVALVWNPTGNTAKLEGTAKVPPMPAPNTLSDVWIEEIKLDWPGDKFGCRVRFNGEGELPAELNMDYYVDGAKLERRPVNISELQRTGSSGPVPYLRYLPVGSVFRVGQYQLKCVLDPENRFSENNETNNSMTKVVDTTPNLQAIQIHLDNSGAVCTVSDHNSDTIQVLLPGQEIVVAFYEDGRKIGEQKTPGNYVGHASLGLHRFQIPWSKSVGRHVLKCVVDPHNQISESNENDNTLEQVVEIAP